METIQLVSLTARLRQRDEQGLPGVGGLGNKCQVIAIALFHLLPTVLGYVRGPKSDRTSTWSIPQPLDLHVGVYSRPKSTFGRISLYWTSKY
jgi:hypothetical protein